jgi:iron complex outermembrane receptor protein
MHPFSRYFALIALTGSAASAVPPASAPASEPAPDTVNLSPVVVTAPSSRQPLVVTTDPKAPAQPMPAHDGADILKNIPGFCVIRKGGADGDPVLRGMAGSRLGVQIDGECIFGGCGNRMDPPTAYVFPAAYDRITVLKGPQSVLHGPGNSAGVVLFERDYRRLAGRESALFGSATAGSFGRHDAALDARTGTPLAQARAALTRTRADDYTDGTGRSVHSAYERCSANAAVAWTPDDRTFVEFSTARSDGEAAYADRAMDGVKFARANYGLRLRRDRLTPLIARAEIRAYSNYVDHVMDNFSLRPFVATAMMPNPAVSNPDRLTRGGLAQLELTPGEATHLTLGLDAQTNTHTLRSSMNQTAMPYEAKARTRDAKFDQAGVFAESAFTLAPGRRLYAGARFDRWEATDSRATVTAGMSAVANPSANRTRTSELASGFARYEQDVGTEPVTLFAGLGRTQRFPDYWELIKNESAGSVSAFGTRPETTTQLDAGVLCHRGPLELSLSAFASRIDDFILVQSAFAKPAGMMGTRSAVITRNIDASTYGGEAGLGWRFTDRWKLDASLAYVRGENDTDSRPLAQLPPLEGRLALAYTQSAWSVGALVRAVAAQERVAVNQGNIVGQDIGPSAGFAVLSLNAGWKPWDRARLSAGIDNLLDRTYAEHISRAGSAVAGFAQTTRVNEPGRTLWLKLDLTY